jgi:anti-sigma factor RsiW
MDCVEAEAWILESLDGTLPPDRGAAVEEHVRGCSACASFRAAQVEIDAALAWSVTAPRLPASFDAEVRRRVQAPRWLGWLERALPLLEPASALSALAAIGYLISSLPGM